MLVKQWPSTPASSLACIWNNRYSIKSSTQKQKIITYKRTISKWKTKLYLTTVKPRNNRFEGTKRSYPLLPKSLIANIESKRENVKGLRQNLLLWDFSLLLDALLRGSTVAAKRLDTKVSLKLLLREANAAQIFRSYQGHLLTIFKFFLFPHMSKLTGYQKVSDSNYFALTLGVRSLMSTGLIWDIEATMITLYSKALQ